MSPKTSSCDMCASHVKLEDGSELMMIVAYIAPNKKINDIISYSSLLHIRTYLYSYAHFIECIVLTNTYFSTYHSTCRSVDRLG